MDYEQKIKKILLKLPHKRQVVFALECANDVKHLMEDPKSLKALKVVEKWLRGEATKEEVKEAVDSAYNTIYAGHFINNAAYYAACTAYYAAYIATFSGIIGGTLTHSIQYAAKAQNIDIKHYYDKLLNSLTELERECYEL